MNNSTVNAQGSSRPVFLHSQFRCASTYIFNRFRSDGGFCTYYEPLHHDLVKLRKHKLDLWGYDSKTTGDVNHPDLNKPHFYEFKRCFRGDEEVLPFFDKAYSYDQFFEVTGEGFKSYIDNMVNSAPEGKRPVLQFNRTSLRVDWFADNFTAGTNVVLIRNPRDQFDSYVSAGGNIFLVMNLIIVTRSSAMNPFARLTRELQLSGYRSENITDEIKHYSKVAKTLSLETHYRVFLSIWIEAYKHAKSYADLVINMDRASREADYRKHIEQALGFAGMFDGYDLKANNRHCVKDRQIARIEHDVLSVMDEGFVSDLRKEYYFEELNTDTALDRLKAGVTSLYSHMSTVLRVNDASRKKHVPVLSIITPSYNQACFIGETIKSVLEQEGDFYIDYILMDGLSDDDTMEIVKSFHCACAQGDYDELNGQRFYRNESIRCRGISFRYISEKDTGQSNALNKGFEMAVGEILGWLNSDDIYYSPLTLSYVVRSFRKVNTNFVYGRGVRVDRNGLFVREEAYVNHYRPAMIKFVDFILQPSAFWRRRVYKEVGQLNEKYHFVFDWDYWVRIAEKFELEKNDDILSCYRVYSETKTSVGGDRREQEIVTMLKSYSAFNEKSIRLNNLRVVIDESI